MKLGEEGVLTLLTETGTRLNTAFLAAGLVDRLHLFISPQIMGSDAVPAFRGMPKFVHMAESKSSATATTWAFPRCSAIPGLPRKILHRSITLERPTM